MGFGWSINPYRGCYHQCVFCYARRTHSYLEEDGVSKWGSRIFVKINAPAVLRSELSKKSWRHEDVTIGSVTDPYQAIEGRYRLTRQILEALCDYDTPASIITRSPLIVRDRDVLARLARIAGMHVSFSIATMNEQLAREIEPTVAPPKQRLRAVTMLAEAGIPVSVALAPVLPRITDTRENIEAVVRAAQEAGAASVWHNTLHLHEVTRDAFFGYLRERHPELIAEYARMYRGKYAPKEIARAICAEVERARKNAPGRYLPQIACEAPEQLGLL
jgi:DNA repair photolyase